MTVATADFRFVNQGSIWLCIPLNDDARAHLADNVSDEAQWFGNGLAVEPPYVNDLAHGLEGAGYTIE